MNSKSMIRRFGQAAALGALSSALAMLQSTNAPPGAADSGALDEIVVTANKREENVRDVPVSIGVVEGKDIESLRVENIEDITRIVPGISFAAHNNGPNGPGQDNITIRGISSTVGNPTVGIYIDEVPIITLTGYEGDAEPRLIDIERVEVLRGPQGTLYGASSEGGTVRFISNPVNLDAYSGSIYSDVSGTKHGGTNYTGRGIVNIPLIDGELGLRAGVVSTKSSGYVDHYNPDNLGQLVSRGVNGI